MKLNKKILFFSFWLLNTLFIKGMSDEKAVEEYSKFDESSSELELLVQGSRAEDLSHEEFLNMPLNICLQVACKLIDKRTDYFIELLSYIFRNQRFLENDNFELALKILRLFLLNKENIEEIEKNLVHDIWANLAKSLQEVYIFERAKLVCSNVLKSKAEEILGCFDNYCSNSKEGYINSRVRQKIDRISDNPEEFLQIIEYIFLHDDEFVFSTEKIHEFFKFVFSDIDDGSHKASQIILDTLSQNYPKFSVLIYDYSDIWENFTCGIKLADLIIKLKSFAKA
jgi:hypothetical protein